MDIVEILKPSVQGRNKAFICRGEDEKIYYVKGSNAGRIRQCSEWVVGNLAREFGLPVPAFQLVTVPEILVEAKPEFQAIGAGVAFASEAQAHAQWFEPGFLRDVPEKTRLDVLVFDWWVRNDDRMEDNPNLLWDAHSNFLHVIDHDSAFSPDFTPTLFKNYHIFHEDWQMAFGDLARQAEFSARMADALSIWEEACHNSPTHWIDHSGARGELFNPAAALKILERCLTTDNWGMK